MKSRGQYDKAARYDYNALWAIEDSLKTVLTLTEHFRFLNNSKSTLKSHPQ